MQKRWQFIGSCSDGQSFSIDGIDVWEHPWQSCAEISRVNVEDPHYHQDFEFAVYEISSSGKTIRFAAGEFSNSIWGFFLQPD